MTVALVGRRWRSTRRLRERSQFVALALAALLGVLSVAWVAYAHVTGATVVVFRTGSMSPTLPQGAAAVSLPTPAADLRVGDIVTVSPLPGALPVTHRIVQIDPVPGRSTARELVLKGDDNDEVDLAPYTVTTALRVEHHLPAQGRWVPTLQTREAKAVLIGAVGLVVLWAFWPRTRTQEQQQEETEDAH